MAVELDLDQHMLHKVVEHFLLSGVMVPWPVQVVQVYGVELHLHLMLQLQHDFLLLVCHWLESFSQNPFWVVNELHVQLNCIYGKTRIRVWFLPFVTIFLLPVTTFPANPPMAFPAAPVASAPTPAPIAVPKPGQTTVPMIAPPAAPPTPPTTAPVTLPVPFLIFQSCSFQGETLSIVIFKNEIHSFNNFINLFDRSFFLCLRLIFTHFKIQKWFNSKTTFTASKVD